MDDRFAPTVGRRGCSFMRLSAFPGIAGGMPLATTLSSFCIGTVIRRSLPRFRSPVPLGVRGCRGRTSFAAHLSRSSERLQLSVDGDVASSRILDCAGRGRSGEDESVARQAGCRATQGAFA